jgi:hypothetical protein
MKSLVKECDFRVCSPAAAAATTDLDGTVIDMAANGGFSKVCFIAMLGDVTATSVLELQGQGSAASDGSSPSTEATTGTKTAGASDCDNKLMVLDLSRPANRYVFSRLKRGTANAVVNGVIAILYNGNTCPVTLNSDVVKNAFANIK